MARNDRYLDEWAARLAQWLERGVRCFVFAHCPIEDHSPAIARELMRRLRERASIPIPALPWESIPDPPTQLGLF